MKRRRFTEEQIIGILKQAEAGIAAKDLCRQNGISETTFYKWRAKFGGMEVSEARRLRQLEEENSRLKKLVADLVLDNTMLKDVASKNFQRLGTRIRKILAGKIRMFPEAGMQGSGCESGHCAT